jgi:hypothetical protein
VIHLKNFNNKRFYNPKIKTLSKVDITKSSYQTKSKVDITKSNYQEPLGPDDLFFSVLFDSDIIIGNTYFNMQPPELKTYLYYLINDMYEQHQNLICLDPTSSGVLLEIKKYNNDKIFYISPNNLRINLLYLLYWYDMQYSHVKSIPSIVDDIQLFKYSSQFLTIQFGLVFSSTFLFRTVLKTTDFLIHFKLEDVSRKMKINYSKSICTGTYLSTGTFASYASNRLLDNSVFRDFSILSNIVYQTHPKTLDAMVSMIRNLV